MTQNWGAPNPGQWPGNQGWNRQPSAWGAPPAPGMPPQQPTPAYQYAQLLNTPPTQAPGFPPGYGQPPYGVPGVFPQPPKPRKNPLLAVIGGGVFVLILGFFLIALVNYLNGGGGGGGNDPTYHQVNNVPAPDYNPPAIPIPKTYEQATDWLRQNAIYDQSVPVPTNCTVPHVDPTTASNAELEEHLGQLTACLWGVWEGPMTEAGFKLPRPPATVYSAKITTPCGEAETGNAFYCAADQHIYYASDLPRILPTKIRTKPFVTDAIMAHEFGHALQARTGILVAGNAWEQKSTKADARVFSRRLEVQADCLAGMWVNAVSKASNVTDADIDNLKFLFNSIGDDVLTGKPNYDGDHGLGKNRQAWATIGLGNSQIGKCNTYVAPASEVR